MAKLWHRLTKSKQEERTGFLPLDFETWLQQIQNSLTTWGSVHPDAEEVIDRFGGALKANGPTFALVASRAMVFSEARFLWRRYENGRPTDLFRTDELEILERPWPGGVTADLLTRMEFDASRSGNAFVRRLRDERRLVVLEPEWMTIVLASREMAETPSEAGDADVFGYIYDPPNGPATMLLPEEVAHYAPLPDPSYRYLGMSWITPVLQDLLGDSASVQHKNTFFNKAATPNLILTFPEKMKADKVEEYGKLIDARHQGIDNAYKTMYLGGGAQADVVGSNFKEMEFAVTQGKAESRLASAAGVPPSWVGFSEGLQGSALNQGNFNAARRRFADGTLRPLWRNAAASLETILTRPSGSSVHLWYDERDIPFLHEDKQIAAEVQVAESSVIVKMVRDGFTPESVVAAVKNNDWDLLEFDERFISVQLQTLENANKQGTKSQDGTGSDDEDSDEEDSDEGDD